MKIGNETFELIELIETTLRSSKFESTSDRILHAVSKILRSSTSFLYLNDKRLPVSQFILKGLQPEIQADMEKLCRELFDTMSDQAEIVPVNLPSCQATEITGNLMVFPLRTREISIGLIGLIVDEDTASTDFIERLLRTIACVIDIHIERAKAERELSNMNNYLTVSSMLTQSFDLHELLEITLSCCMEATSAEAASILLLDDKKKNFYFYEITGPAKAVLMTKTFPADKGIAGAVMQSQQSEIINDVQNDSRFFRQIDSESGFHTRNILVIPLVAGDEKIGVLEVLNKTNGASFTEDEHLFLKMIAEEIAFAIRNAKVFDYVVNSYCKQRQGLATCKGCKRPLGSWTPCIKYQNLSDDGKS